MGRFLITDFNASKTVDIILSEFKTETTHSNINSVPSATARKKQETEEKHDLKKKRKKKRKQERNMKRKKKNTKHVKILEK